MAEKCSVELLLDVEKKVEMTPKSAAAGLLERSLIIASVVLIALLILAQPAVAQMVDEGVRQDNVDRLDSSRPILEYIIAGVCIFGSLAIGFKSSNRTAAT